MNRVARLTFIALLAVAACGAAFAQFQNVSDQVDYDFSGANLQMHGVWGTSMLYFNDVGMLATNIGDTTTWTWNTKSLAQGFSWQTSDNFSLSYIQSSQTQYTGQIQALGPFLFGNNDIAYAVPTGADFIESFITLSRGSGGNYILNVSTPDEVSLRYGSVYDVGVLIPGDWATQGTAIGDHNLISFNPDWKILANFVHEGNITFFFAQEDSYHGDNPNLQFQLIGSSLTPEPSSWVLLCTGIVSIVSIVGVVRRKLMP